MKSFIIDNNLSLVPVTRSLIVLHKNSFVEMKKQQGIKYGTTKYIKIHNMILYLL